MWVKQNGEPMKGNKIGDLIKRMYKKFNPALEKSIIDIRRDTITNVFATLEQEDLEKNIPSLERWLNVSRKVMEKHYNR